MKTNQRGQILLIIILLSTVLVTVALSVSQVTTQETKIAKLEEDSKRAFAAAEAGIEVQLKKPITETTTISSILPSSLGDYITNGSVATTAIDTSGTQFYTDIRRDDQYTFYLNTYNPTTKQFTGPAYNNGTLGTLTFYFLSCSSSSSCPTTQPAIELTFIGTNNTNIARKIIDPAPVMNAQTGATDVIPMATTGSPFPLTINGQTQHFKYMTQLNSLAINGNVNLMLIRVLIPDGTANTLRVVVEGSTALPAQGQTITSTATTKTGVAKKITLFQSYPQIPADLFVTSF